MSLIQNELPSLLFKPSIGENSHRTRATGPRIARIHTVADAPGASFDLVIKDTLGRTKFQKLNCTSETEAYGEFINMETRAGEEFEVSIENLKGANELRVFVN